MAKREGVRTDFLRADSRGLNPPNIANRATCMKPLATMQAETGDLVWDADIVDEIKALATKPKRG